MPGDAGTRAAEYFGRIAETLWSSADGWRPQHGNQRERYPRSDAHPCQRWAPFGINVNAMAPGYFPTKMMAQLDTDTTSKMALMKRGGGPESLKNVTALFASDACAFITGQTLAVDDGVTAI
ncbi:SDR family oxidoreductase [Bradyrhizobium jicamae]|uniref:SDR family oxidoreductase n=1 Tax=Bradyrhizobium jicamae TaxID=280332 RepID=UPI002010E454|nr:SDR family oxidoreductase [Bradyrhizobium jicamae]